MEAFGKPPYLGNVSEGLQDVNIITLLFFLVPNSCHTYSRDTKTKCTAVLFGYNI